MFASTTDRWPEIHAQLGAAIHAADDARDFDGAYPQVALDEHAGTLGVLTEAAQLAALHRVAARMHQQDRARRSASHLVSHAAENGGRPRRTDVGAQQDEAHVMDQCLLDDGWPRRAGAQNTFSVDTRAAQMRANRVKVRACDRFARRNRGRIDVAGAQNVQQDNVRAQRAGVLFSNRNLDLARWCQIQGQQDGGWQVRSQKSEVRSQKSARVSDV